eukprot:s203_g6.t1
MSYMEKFDGSTKQGPFAKLLEVCKLLHWTIVPPFLYDHHGVLMEWLDVDEKVLYDMAQEAWSWKLHLEVCGRKDFAGLHGIDHRVLRQSISSVPAHLQPLIWRLQDGTFLEPKQHGRYDLGVTGKCQLCGLDDSLEHRCTACPARRRLYEKHPITQRWSEMPISKKLRLVPSVNPHWQIFKDKASQATDQVQRERPHFGDTCHLFTDGSCFGSRHKLYQLSAWAVVNASTDQRVVKGTLGGLGQGNDRAELKAIIAAVEIAFEAPTETTIWTDSTFIAAEGTIRMLKDIEDVPGGHCENDWKELQGLLYHRQVHIFVRHVPGHANWSNFDDDFDNWAARWNDRVDREAKSAMRLHGTELLALHQRL